MLIQESDGESSLNGREEILDEVDFTLTNTFKTAKNIPTIA